MTHDAEPDGDLEAFPHGIASFDPTDTSVLLWARTEVGDRVDWIVARDEQLDDVVASGEAAIDPESDCTATVDVDGLEPATAYHYAFTVDGRRSPVGRTRTLPRGPVERVRLGMVSCANLARAPLTVYRGLAGMEDLDLVLHMGDYIYEDDGAKGDIPVDPPHYLVTVDDYRRRYRQARHDPNLLALHLRYPMVAIWDDHDVADNAFDTGAKEHDPEEHGPWEDRLAAATQARQEYVPARLPDPDDAGHLWRSVTIGDLAEVVVLDARLGGRDEQPDSDDESGDIDDPDRSLLSDEQWAWATERIEDRTRPWVVITSQVPVSEMLLPMPEGLDLDAPLPDGYTLQQGRAICTDQWDGYPAERRRLAEVLARRGGGALVLSADVHSSWVFDGPFDPDGRPVAGELTGSSVSSTTMGGNLGRIGTALAERIADRMDHVRWVDLDRHGFMVVELTRERARGEMWAVDPADRDARAERMTTWDLAPEAGARWQEVTDPEPTGDPGDPDVVVGPPPVGDLPPPPGRRRRRLLAVAGAAALLGSIWLRRRRR
jgi:alkaline phosphatase D